MFNILSHQEDAEESCFRIHSISPWSEYLPSRKQITTKAIVNVGGSEPWCILGGNHSLEVSQQTRNKTTVCPNVKFTDIYSKKSISYCKDTCSPIFIATLAKRWDGNSLSVHHCWKDNKNVIPLHNGILLK